MNFFKLTALILSFCISHVLPAKADCDLKHLEGKVFYGEFNYYSDATFIMRMQIDKVKGCELEGTFLWPDYYNTKTTFSGRSEGGTIHITEEKILQGMIMDNDRSHYTIDELSEEGLSGTAYVDGDDVATFKVTAESRLSKPELARYTEKINELTSIFGETIIGKKAKISLEELKSAYKQHTPSDDFPGMKLEGIGVFSQVEFPMQMYYMPPKNFYMEMQFQNIKFMIARNDSISWSYDPSTDEVTVTPIEEEGSDNFEQFSVNFLDDLDADPEWLTINHASVSGIPAYRVAFKTGEEVEAHYLAEEHYQVIRQEVNFEVKEYLEYTSFKGYLIPKIFRQLAPSGSVNIVRFEKMEEANNLDSELFEIPESLKTKIVSENGPSVSDLGNTAFEEGDFKRAVELYSKAIENYPYDDVLYYNRGKAYYELGDNYKSLGDFERAIDLAENESEYFNYLGLVKYRLGDYQNALTDFQVALQKDSLHTIAYLNAAFSYFNLNEMDSALLYIDRGLANDSTNGQFHLNRGIINYQLKNFEESITDYERTLELAYGDSASIQNRLGVDYYQLESYEKAADYFKIALEGHPENYQMRKNLANAYYYSGMHTEAIDAYHKALELKSDDDDLLNHMAQSYYGDGDYQTAVHYLNEAIEINDENAYYYDNRAYAYAGLMRFQEAIEDFTKSIELYPKDPEVYFQRGIAYKLQNNRFDACRDFKTAMEMEHNEAQTELDEYCQIGQTDVEEE